ncbi:hypothetical protein [Halobacillus karajensis]|uniref:Uncharacterized protein n=1 Tax=Halobacillus karajensis TaxID=195088 RepID=A0A059NYQ3_9BACI|nr:hypothetical protein [Halobacillus karajensis]CDQ22627.1 hypothetical protein BN983_00840 [Halobacillus karajensis]CDQ26109.1 hypothetical protein BN981_00320 [Halobacillus karajensis]
MNLADAPDCVFDFVNEFIEREGEFPSYEDFENEFGNKYPFWSEKMPDTRYEIESEVDDEEFGMMTPEDELKDRGLRITDFY